MSEPRLGRFDHVGIAVANLEHAVETYVRSLGAVAETETFSDENQQVRLRFLNLGGMRIELLQPDSERSPLNNILKRGIGIYHVCHEVDDLDAELERLKAEGVKVISPPKPAVAFGNRRVAFTMCQGLMLELLEAALP